MNQSATLIVCALCGTVGGERPPLDWVLSTEHGRTVAYCPSCARDNLRAIEAGLDPAYW
jgi:hypothetical protein